MCQVFQPLRLCVHLTRKSSRIVIVIDVFENAPERFLVFRCKIVPFRGEPIAVPASLDANFLNQPGLGATQYVESQFDAFIEARFMSFPKVGSLNL